MKILVGYTGFVGSNLYENGDFDFCYNSKNIKESYGKNPDLLVYAGLRAEKFLANKYPEEDMDIVNDAIENIKQINPKTVVLISSIDVYKNSNLALESTLITTEGLLPYGSNRFYLEQWVEENFENHLIVRLPGLYGKNIKKNFIYDLIYRIPSMLTREKIDEIGNEKKDIYNFYTLQDNGFYKCNELSVEERNILKTFFINSEFSALNFTDSRGLFQFYNLKYLFEHISISLANEIKRINISTEPISISELYNYIEGKTFSNEITNEIPYYNFKTEYENVFSGADGYIFDKKFILNDIKNFVQNYGGK